MGRILTLNPVMIFISIMFWGWIWGISGALLAVPLLAALKITCDHLQPLQLIGEFVGGEAEPWESSASFLQKVPFASRNPGYRYASL